MSKRYRSEVCAAIHQTIEDLHQIGLVDKNTKRKFDDSCLIPVEELPPEEIRQLRENQNIQGCPARPIFARRAGIP